MPLLGGSLQITEVILTGADLLLEVDSADHGNWQIAVEDDRRLRDAGPAAGGR